MLEQPLCCSQVDRQLSVTQVLVCFFCIYLSSLNMKIRGLFCLQSSHVQLSDFVGALRISSFPYMPVAQFLGSIYIPIFFGRCAAHHTNSIQRQLPIVERARKDFLTLLHLQFNGLHVAVSNRRVEALPAHRKLTRVHESRVSFTRCSLSTNFIASLRRTVLRPRLMLTTMQRMEMLSSRLLGLSAGPLLATSAVERGLSVIRCR